MVASLIMCLTLPTIRADDEAPATSRLRVVVTGPDGTPVAATVQAGESPTLATDAAGAVELDLPGGWVTVDVEAPGFLRDRVPGVAIVSTETRTLTIPMRRAAALRGVVLDERGAPREGAVAFVRVASGERMQVRSDAAGRFALLDALAPGPARLLFSSAEPTPQAAAVDVAVPPEGLDVVVTLAPCPTLAGRVVGPVERASLVCRDAPHTQGEVHVDGEGRLTSPAALALGPWVYELWLQGPSGLVTIAPVDLAVAAAERVFDAGGASALEGVVRDEDGAPLALAPLALFVDAGARRARSTTQRSDARGRFAFEGLPAGRAVVYAHPDARGGFAVLDLTGPRAQVDLRAPRRALITARVRDADGAPVVDLPLLAVPDEPLLGRLPLDDRGETRASSGARFGLPLGWSGRVEADPRALEVLARARGARRAVMAPARVTGLAVDLDLTLALHLE